MITLKHKRGVQDTYLGKYTVPAKAFVRVDGKDVNALMETGQFEKLEKETKKPTIKEEVAPYKATVKEAKQNG